MSAGEPAAGTDTAAVAGSVQTVIAGAGLTWALDRRGTLAERLEREIGAVLAPHRPRKGSNHGDDHGDDRGEASAGR